MITRMSGNRSRRDRAAATIAKPLIRQIARRIPGWHGLLVLNYHRVGDHEGQPWDHGLWSASREAFDDHLATLNRHAEVIGPEDVEVAIGRGRRGRRVMLTFDDGYRDNFELAYPMLRKHGLTATFFLATGFIDRPHVPWWDEIAWMVRHARVERMDATEWLALPAGEIASANADRHVDRGAANAKRHVDLATADAECHVDLVAADAAIARLVSCYKQLPSSRTTAFLDHIANATGSGRCALDASDLWVTWEMAREMRAGGMTIGGHTVTHPVLSSIPVERQREEIALCGARLQEELGEPMRWFAYPVGATGTFTAETQQILRGQGVRLAFSFYGGHGSFARWDPLDVPRVHVGRGHDAQLIQAMVLLPRLFARW